MTAEEHERRGYAAVALFRELTRPAAVRCCYNLSCALVGKRLAPFAERVAHGMEQRHLMDEPAGHA